MIEQQAQAARSEVVDAKYWHCEKCNGHHYVLVERGLERLSWCLDCYGESGEVLR